MQCLSIGMTGIENKGDCVQDFWCIVKMTIYTDKFTTEPIYDGPTYVL